jgi:hypothetical protein
VHFIVILADESTHRPRFFRRDFEARHLPNEVTHQSVASAGGQIDKHHD